MLRSELITGIQALRHELDFLSNIRDESKAKYFDDILQECRRAVLLNEQNDPYSK